MKRVRSLKASGDFERGIDREVLRATGLAPDRSVKNQDMTSSDRPRT
jgi:hypothetical protein